MDRIAKIILTILLLSVSAIEFVQVITRYVMHAPLIGLEDVLLYPVIWLYIVGSINASREDTQIRANVLEVFIESEKAKKIQLIIANIISLAIGIWLVYWAWDLVEYSLRVNKESPTLYIPTIYADVSLFVGLLLMCIFESINILKSILTINSTDNEGHNHA